VSINPIGRSRVVKNGKEGRRKAEPRSSPASRAPLRSFPSNWEMGAAELKDAREIAGWDANEARRQFVRFREYHRDLKDNRFKDWSVAWHRWCEEGLKIDERDEKRASQSGRRRETGFEASMRGLQDWLDTGEE
jgi:hypothetical protein